MPNFANGKICYLEIPATDIAASARFYADCFDWTLRNDDAGNPSFDDTVGEVSGMWVTDRPPMSEPGIVISIMVTDAVATMDKVVKAGGEVVRPVDPDAAEVLGWFRDPGGNVLGIYQHVG